MSLAVSLALSAPLAAGPDVAGRASVTDGDTLDVAGETIRLFGIDAPEMSQRCRRGGRDWACGVWSRDYLTALVRGQRVNCAGLERDRYGRLVAQCTVGGMDIGAAMVRDGAARAFVRYSSAYVEIEKRAIFGEVGLWASEFQDPWSYRAAPSVAVSRTDGCVIKGNISGNGRIYHMPGQEHYSRTRISEANGERWFCSEAEAKASGWRRARR